MQGKRWEELFAPELAQACSPLIGTADVAMRAASCTDRRNVGFEQGVWLPVWLGEMAGEWRKN